MRRIGKVAKNIYNDREIKSRVNLHQSLRRRSSHRCGAKVQAERRREKKEGPGAKEWSGNVPSHGMVIPLSMGDLLPKGEQYPDNIVMP